MTDRFVKIGTDGAQLPAGAAEWEAVLDTSTGLMWSVTDKEVGDWKEADDAAKEVRAAGFEDWRLPTVDELFMLADRTRIRPAIDTDFFPDCKNDWYWSSTPYARSPGGCAWLVNFYYGGADWGAHDDEGFVRAVRPGQ